MALFTSCHKEAEKPQETPALRDFELGLPTAIEDVYKNEANIGDYCGFWESIQLIKLNVNGQDVSITEDDDLLKWTELFKLAAVEAAHVETFEPGTEMRFPPGIYEYVSLIGENSGEDVHMQICTFDPALLRIQAAPEKKVVQMSGTPGAGYTELCRSIEALCLGK
jgi:hypothetical protein